VELLFVRHGLPERIDDAGGPADPGLASEGRDQAGKLAAALTGFPIDAVYTSPMQRARETAAPLALALGRDAAVDDDLMEFDRDLTYYVPIEELRGSNDPRWAELVTEWTSVESEDERQAFRLRVVTAVERIVERHPSQRVAVVCHGGVINAYLSHVLRIDQTLFFEPGYASISRVLASRGGHRQLVTANETPHLSAQPLS
jgi:2,3-bisphosphoglycerate-dependent phosphoglycerate mutase